MTSKEYLKRHARHIEKLETMIGNKIDEQQKWKAISLNITSHLDGERVQSSGGKQKMADAIDRCVDMQNEINQLIDRMIDVKKEVLSVIEELNAAEYDVLHKLYIQRMSFDDVAMAKERSKSWVTTVHGRALVNVKHILNERGIN